jgi:hypothetical protein
LHFEGDANLLGKESKEERKRAKEDAKEVERAEKKEKAALEITKSQGKSPGMHWNRGRCKWVAMFRRRQLGYFDDRAEDVAAHSSYSSSQ